MVRALKSEKKREGISESREDHQLRVGVCMSMRLRKKPRRIKYAVDPKKMKLFAEVPFGFGELLA